MKLFATPKSHFSRKVRLLLDHLGKDYELVDVGNVAEAAPANFSGNPSLSVPILEDGDVWMIESDHIAGYLAKTDDPQDTFDVRTDAPELLNVRAVLNGVMANEVKLILSARTGLDPKPHAYFRKAETAINHSLAWLEQHADLLCGDRPTYTHFHFISMWDHLLLYDLVDLNYPLLARAAEVVSQNPITKKSKPPKA